MGIFRAPTATGLLVGLTAIMAASLPLTASAYEWQKGDFSFRIDNRVNIGAGWRLQSRDPDLLGKLNVPGQQHLCDGDDCISLNGDPAPNQRLVDARGGFIAENYDNGDLNYDKGDMVTAIASYDFNITGTWKDVKLKLRGLAYYDPINEGFREHHTNTKFQPAYTPRSDYVEGIIGKRIYMKDAFVEFPISFGEKTLHVSVGEQRIRWGESTFVAVNSISEWNPPDQNLLYQPGATIADIFQPVGLISLSMNLTENLSAQLIYQYDWKPAMPAAAGGFWSTIDIAGGGEDAVISLGQFAEDPDQKGTLQGLAALITSTHTTVPILSRKFGYPKNGGQYGLKLSGYLPNFNNGTEWGLYAMNYHSRLPYGSVYATDDSCMRNDTDIATALVDCGGFNGLRPQLFTALTAAVPALAPTLASLNASVLPGKEPLPIDTMKIFIDYPEDIHMFGASFNTNIGLWSLAGELSYRPNLPLQVSLSDVLFAALQPTFPRQDVPIPGLATIPGARNAVPDYIETRYRGHDVKGNQLIRGYERMKVAQVDFTGLRSIGSSNWLKADQIIILLEAGATQVFDMPGLNELQFEGGGANASHFSPGADGSGSGGVPDSRRFNPHQQTDGFATDFSWGVRSLVQIHYADLIFGWNVIPTFALNYDVAGVAPFPVQNFIEGTLNYQLGGQIEFTQDMSFTLLYQGWTGGKDLDKLSDRDYIAANLTYSF